MLHLMPQNSSDTPETDTPTATTAKIPAKIAAAYLAALRGSALPGEGDDMDKAALAEASQFVGRASLDRNPEIPSLLLEPMAADGTDRRMRLVIVNDDMPFLVDSTSQVVTAQGLAVHRILHPVVAVARDSKGHLTEAGSGPDRESVIYMELERGDARARRRLVDALEAALRDVRDARRWRGRRIAALVRGRRDDAARP
jgi:glutamate dehydrogenase